MSYFYGKQSVNDDDVKAVLAALQSDWLTQGPHIERFERALCNTLGSKHATVVSSGTAALHLTALGLGWSDGDIVITSPISFLASANCILYAGATPDFCDIDPIWYTIDVNKLDDKLKSYRQKNKRVKAVVGVDFAGHPCDWKSLRALADQYEFQLVNDACHALGAVYCNQKNYGTTYADAVIYSFHPVKSITSGEGGAIVTDHRKLDDKVKLLRTHGVTKDSEKMEQHDGPWYYEMQELGFNYRITDLHCALGISQLSRLSEFIEKRNAVAAFYDAAFDPYDAIQVPQIHPDASHARHLYTLAIDFERLGVDKVKFFPESKSRNINLQVHYIPIHLQPFYRKKYGFKPGDFRESEAFYRRAVSLPIYPDLAQTDLEYITTRLLEILT